MMAGLKKVGSQQQQQQQGQQLAWQQTLQFSLSLSEQQLGQASLSTLLPPPALLLLLLLLQVDWALPSAASPPMLATQARRR
jgi:hypothetical protein